MTRGYAPNAAERDKVDGTEIAKREGERHDEKLGRRSLDGRCRPALLLSHDDRPGDGIRGVYVRLELRSRALYHGAPDFSSWG